jgi:hypothetical protein
LRPETCEAETVAPVVEIDDLGEHMIADDFHERIQVSRRSISFAASR